MRIAFVLLLIATILLPVSGGTGISPIRQANQTISLEEYWAKVEQTRQTVSGLQGASDSTIHGQLNKLAGEWEAITQVKLPDGTILPVDHNEMAALFRQEPPVIATVLGRLDALQAMRQDFPDRKFTKKDIDSLTKILADPRFQWAEAKPSPLSEWWGNFWNKLFEWLNRLFGDSSSSVSLSIPGGRILLTWVLTILLAGILVYAGRGLWKDLVGQAELEEGWADGAETLTSETAFQRASVLSGDGDYRTAVRYLYLSSLLLLDERGLLRFDRSRTNHEYLRSLSGAPLLAKPLRAVIDIFDRVWYGFEQIDQATYQDYIEQVGELRKQKP
jgi:hypothetical protein